MIVPGMRIGTANRNLDNSRACTVESISPHMLANILLAGDVFLVKGNRFSEHNAEDVRALYPSLK